MGDEIEELRARVAELERRIDVLFQHTGAMDMEAEARTAPAVSDEVRQLIAAGKPHEALKRYQEETGAEMAAAMAALGEAAKEMRGD